MAAPEEVLPAPASGMMLELSFRRLLASCEDISHGDDKGREDLQQWRTSPVFHHYVETLQEQLADLGTAGKVDKEMMQRYHQRARALAAQLERAEVPAYCRLPAAASRANGAPGSAAPGALPAAAGDMRPRVSAAVAAVTVPKAPAAAATAAGAPRPVPLSEAARKRLAAQGQVQEALTDELADMASALRSNTLAMEGKVRERGTLLDSTEQALETSLAGTKASASKATALHRRGRINFCFTFLVLLIIGVGFAAMYMFIRVTSFVGYKAPRGQAPVPPPPVQPTLQLGHQGEL